MYSIAGSRSGSETIRSGASECLLRSRIYRARSGFCAYASGVPRAGSCCPCLVAAGDAEEDEGGDGGAPEDEAPADNGPSMSDEEDVDWYL